MLNKKIVLISLLLSFNTHVFGANANNFIPYPKPNFFPKEETNISASKIYINKEELKKSKINNQEIKKVYNYYLNNTSKFFKSKKENGFIIYFIEVNAIKNRDKSIDCEKEPTKCSLTKMNFLFSSSIPDDKREEYSNYIITQTQKDNIEVFLTDFDYDGNLKFSFVIYLDEDSKTKSTSLINKEIDKFFSNKTSKDELKKSKKYLII